MNMFDLTGKIALVTGGAHSIGFAMGRGLAKAGAKVCFNCTSESSRQRGIANYAAEGIEAYGYVANVTSEAEMNALVAQIRQVSLTPSAIFCRSTLWSESVSNSNPMCNTFLLSALP